MLNLVPLEALVRRFGFEVGFSSQKCTEISNERFMSSEDLALLFIPSSEQKSVIVEKMLLYSVVGCNYDV